MTDIFLDVDCELGSLPDMTLLCLDEAVWLNELDSSVDCNISDALTSHSTVWRFPNPFDDTVGMNVTDVFDLLRVVAKRRMLVKAFEFYSVPDDVNGPLSCSTCGSESVFSICGEVSPTLQVRETVVKCGQCGFEFKLSGRQALTVVYQVLDQFKELIRSKTDQVALKNVLELVFRIYPAVSDQDWWLKNRKQMIDAYLY